MPATRSALAYPRGHPVFEGHFPGRPIVPGAALLADVLALVEAATSRPPQAWELAQAKFLATVAPDEPLTVLHEALPSGAVRFEVTGPRGAVATGMLAPREPR